MSVSFSAAAIAAALILGPASADAEPPSVLASPRPVASADALAPHHGPDAAAPLWWQLFVGEFFEEDIDLYDRDGPSTYRVADHSRLPKGLTLDARTGVVSGIPEEEIVQLTTFLVIDDETGGVREQFAFFRVDNP